MCAFPSLAFHAREEQWKQWLPTPAKQHPLLSRVFFTWVLPANCSLRLAPKLRGRMWQQHVRLIILRCRTVATAYIVANRNRHACLLCRLRACVQTPPLCLVSQQICRKNALPRTKRQHISDFFCPGVHLHRPTAHRPRNRPSDHRVETGLLQCAEAVQPRLLDRTPPCKLLVAGYTHKRPAGTGGQSSGNAKT